jgi:hypothetical protein
VGVEVVLGDGCHDGGGIPETPEASMTDHQTVSGLRIALMVGGVLALIPLTILFGLIGLLGGLFFLLLAALAT